MISTYKIRNYIISCLVALQLLAPFLHAHIWGEGMVKKSQGFHLHLDSLEQVDNIFKIPTIQSEKAGESSIGVLPGITGKFQFDTGDSLLFSWLFLICPLIFAHNILSFTSLFHSVKDFLPPPRASPI